MATVPMHEDIRNEWTDWLRDPATVQHMRQLAWGNGRCCWGGLFDIAVEHGVAEKSDNSYRMNGDTDWCAGYPSDRLLEWAGIDKEAGPSSNIVLYLASRNDNGSNFAFIAEDIEAYLG